MLDKITSKKLRSRMVAEQLCARDIQCPRVLEAMEAIPREFFVGEEWTDQAYVDAPLPIDEGQTISQPYIVAFMLQALKLKGGERILEIGSGSGYAAAVLSHIAHHVFTIERLKKLAILSENNLRRAHIANVTVRFGDGTLGWKDEAPFEAILVSAGAPKVPEALKEQLTIGGRMVIPVGNDPYVQDLVCVTRKTTNKYEEEDLTSVRFVPLIGAGGWKEERISSDS